MESTKTLYLALEQSKAVYQREVKIKDIATLFCTDPDIRYNVEKLSIFTFPKQEEASQVVTAMKLIEQISLLYKDLTIHAIGEPETILYYKEIKKATRITDKMRAAFLIMVAFLGAAYSIMSYNTDVGATQLLNQLHELYTGNTPTGPTIGMLAYSIGLCIGIIVFFNHGIMNKLSDDPTPLQVQMRLYEQNVNKTVITDSGRNNETIDVK
jgi:stage V sporulation protein AA